MMGPWLIDGALMLGATLRALRGHARLSRAGPPLASSSSGTDRPCSASRRRSIRALMAQGRRVGRRARPLVAARPRLDRRSRGTRTRGAGTSSDVGGGRCPIINYSGGTEIARRHRRLHDRCRRRSPAPSPARCRAWPPTWSTTPGEPVRGAVGELVDPQPWVGHDARLLARPASATSTTYWSRMPGLWVHGDWARSTTTASGSSWAARTTRSRSPASGSARPRSSRRRSATRPCRRRRRSACRIRSRARRSSSSSSCAPATQPSDGAARRRSGDGRRATRHGRCSPSGSCFVRDLPKTRNAKIMRRVIRAA